MCGIFGIWNADHDSINPIALHTSTDLLRHRGPDDEGYLLLNTLDDHLVVCGGQNTDQHLGLPWLDSQTDQPFDLAFGFRRLAILDLSPAGHQPMGSADGRYWIVFNGEIYNYLELRTELSRLGYPFRSGSDTEVILAAYAEWGIAMLNRFVGMFAFAILDRKAQRLCLVRDFFGIKPLYYTQASSHFAFASEIKALLNLSGVSRCVNPQRLFNYLSTGLTDHGAETMFADVRQLPAAHYLEIDLKEGVIQPAQRYWCLAVDPLRDITLDEATTRLKDLFLENIRLHLRSDVPVGSCLSGGIDSSSIVMGMRHLEGPALALHTFSAVFDDATIGEEHYVDIAAGAAQSVVHKVMPTAQELVADLDHLVYVQEEPFGSTSIYAQQRVFKLAGAAGIKVMLDGQGADELLGGYRSALGVQLAALTKQARWRQAWRLLDNMALLPGVNQKTMLKASLSLLLPPSVQTPVRHLRGTGLPPTWLNQAWFAAKGVALAQPSLSPYTGSHLLHQYLHDITTRTSLPMLLRYEDRNSMSHSIESRVPFLTPALAQFIFSLPANFIVNEAAETKAVFRRAMRRCVPDAILDRKDKIGFSTPEQRWLNTLKPWVDQTLKNVNPASIPALNLSEVRSEWEMVAANERPFDWRIWRWINVIRWMEIYQINGQG